MEALEFLFLNLPVKFEKFVFNKQFHAHTYINEGVLWYIYSGPDNSSPLAFPFHLDTICIPMPPHVAPYYYLSGYHLLHDWLPPLELLFDIA